MASDSDAKILQLDKFTMEPLQLSDLDSLARIWSDSEVTRFLPSRGVPIPREKTEKALVSFVEHWEKLGYGIWKIKALWKKNKSKNIVILKSTNYVNISRVTY